MPEVMESGRLTDAQAEAFKATLSKMLADEAVDKAELAGRLGMKDEDEMRRAVAPSTYVARARFDALEDLAGKPLGKRTKMRERRATDRSVGRLKEAYDCVAHAHEIVEELGLDIDLTAAEAELKGAVRFAEFAMGRAAA